LVTYADMPLLQAETLTRLVDAQRTNPGALSMLTVQAPDPRGFGRVLRDAAGAVQAIIEEAAATPEQLRIRELNVGAYCFRSEWLWQALHRIPVSKKGEYYLTDLVALAVGAGLAVQTIQVEDTGEIIGINTRLHLAEAEAVMRRRINTAHMLAGVTMIDPQAVYIHAGVRIGRDTIIHPGTCLEGSTTIGEGCVLGPETLVRDSIIGDACKVFKSVVESARVDEGVDIGPYAHLRKGAHLCAGVHMGNFGEVKDSTLGPGTKMGHFSYIGNAVIGGEVNIGAGTITCNYDGQNKNPTEIGEGSFIGSDTMLVAPLKLGKRARTGAGAVVTRDVPDDTLVVGVPARPVHKTDPGKPAKKGTTGKGG
jgi:bifunctional UDP-N-acetylglucosamine pyrophosphorylase/glucosamine-1-phosphate N-acetyltransferase